MPDRSHGPVPMRSSIRRRPDCRSQTCVALLAEAAALPLTTLTAWEAMFDRLDVAKPVPGAAEAILIIGGAGGVGSIAVQIARQRTTSPSSPQPLDRKPKSG